MKIKVLGTGCSACKALHAAVLDTVKDYGLSAEVEKVEDMVRIMEYNVMTLPALVVDGKVVARGKLSREQVKQCLIN